MNHVKKLSEVKPTYRYYDGHAKFDDLKLVKLNNSKKYLFAIETFEDFVYKFDERGSFIIRLGLNSYKSTVNEYAKCFIEYYQGYLYVSNYNRIVNMDFDLNKTVRKYDEYNSNDRMVCNSANLSN